MNHLSVKRSYSYGTCGCRLKPVRFGYFYRHDDNSRQQRYRCTGCRKTFSDASFSPAFRQKKRHLNGPLLQWFASGLSQRRLSINLRINRKTVVRKFLFLGHQSALYLDRDLSRHAPSKLVQFDDLETFEHSKLKPLSVCMMVVASRRILGFSVAQMPCKGKLAKRSRKKYGSRRDQRKRERDILFKKLKPHIDPNAKIQSDQSPHYPASVKTHFPNAQHEMFLSRRGCVVGQGELKSGGFDPLFSLNHTFAMFRANINRLFRRTWNTTKKRHCLKLHIAIYALFHNWKLIPRTKQRPTAYHMLMI